MGNFLFYLGAFALALGLLIVIHEAGHFMVARLFDVKVLRFSLGFGRPLLKKRLGRDGTELVLAVFPLGGYVKMLDEREGEVARADQPRAFNRQSVWKRSLIVLAGPAANFILAMGIYWLLYLHGFEEPRPILGAPAAHSLAERAGFRDGQTIVRVDDQPIETWQAFRWEMLQSALDHQPVVRLETVDEQQRIEEHRLNLATYDTGDLEADILAQMGFRFHRPNFPAIIGALTPGGPAERAGILPGDRVLAIDGRAVANWGELAERIRAALDRPLRLQLERAGQHQEITAVPEIVVADGQRFGRLGIQVRDDASWRQKLYTTVRYGPLTALGKAVELTWRTSVSSLEMLGQMIVGNLSWKNLSGPVTIADYAGQTARMGLLYYAKFLALISISLGVLNLLPIPLLDGGHLMYYTAEIIKGRPLSERVMEVGQQIGLVLLAMLMAFAFYNDINRLISG